MPGDWLTKQEAADFLGRSPRRTLEIVQEQGIPSREERVKGARLAQKTYEAAALKRYKAARDAPRPATITVAREGQDGAPPLVPQWMLEMRKHLESAPNAELDKPLTPAERKALTLNRVSKAHARVLAKFGAEMNQVPEPKPHHWLTLREAAAYTHLSRSLLESACESGRLASVWDGPASKQRRMVHVEDLQSLRF